MEDVVKTEIIKNFDISGNETKAVSKIKKDESSYPHIITWGIVNFLSNVEPNSSFCEQRQANIY